ncbi:MAG: hypothetical protein IKC81_04590 [Paludibacteraceae bacterium]|nr:hypothetical protein [Paludibacteraceae bacterium]
MTDNIIFRPGGEEPVSVVAEACNETHHVQYLGYARRGTKNLDEARYCILRIACDKATGITTYEWSNGSLERNVPFTDRENIEYSFLI